MHHQVGASDQTVSLIKPPLFCRSLFKKDTSYANVGFARISCIDKQIRVCVYVPSEILVPDRQLTFNALSSAG